MFLEGTGMDAELISFAMLVVGYLGFGLSFFNYSAVGTAWCRWPVVVLWPVTIPAFVAVHILNSKRHDEPN